VLDFSKEVKICDVAVCDVVQIAANEGQHKSGTAFIMTVLVGQSSGFASPGMNGRKGGSDGKVLGKFVRVVLQLHTD